jgi:hypothetical protein
MAFKSSRYDEISLEISVKKAELLVILKKNREQHKALELSTFGAKTLCK